MAQRTLEQACARMLMVGFPGKTVDPALLQLMSRGIFGAILFKRNVGTAQETAELCFELKTAARRPFVLSVDQEGGRVARLRGAPFTALPPMRQLGASLDASLLERVGRLLAHELRAIGFDWDFAPVLDVDTNPNNPVIGDRAFHQEPHWVSTLGVALARGLEAGGVASCAKHFPGHGDTAQDSHLTLPRLPHDLKRLQAVELPPFEAYARAHLAAVMTAHVLFDAIDPGIPATLSKKVMTDLLRTQLGFDGVIVSDDLEMKAIADRMDLGEAAVLGALAGVDLFLVCHHADRQNATVDALIAAVESGRLPRSRVDDANARLDVVEKRFAHPPQMRVDTLGTAAHRALSQGIEASSASLRDPTEVLA